MNLKPGIYYQDVLADGSYSVLRQNFKRSPVVKTLMIEVTELDPENMPEKEDFFIRAKWSIPNESNLKTLDEILDKAPFEPRIKPEIKPELSIEDAQILFSGGKPDAS
jgi:hypothetical protein